MPTLAGMALCWVGLAMLFGVVPTLVLALLMSGLVAAALIRGRKLRVARAQAPPSPADAHDNAADAYELARLSHLAYLVAAPLLVAVILYEFGVTTGAILTAAGLLVLAIGGIPSRRAHMAALRERIGSGSETRPAAGS